MAKIVLNVELNNQKVPAGIKQIREQIASLGDAFNKIQNSKDVTDGVKALTQHYQSLINVAKQVSKAEQDIALKEEKVRTQRAKTAAELQKANDAHRISTEKLRTAEAKTIAEEVKVEQQKTKLAKATVELLDKEKKLTAEQEKLRDSWGKFLPAVKDGETNVKHYNSELVKVENTLSNIVTPVRAARIDFDKLFQDKPIEEWTEKLEEAHETIDKVFGNAAIRLWRTWWSEVKNILGDVNDVLTKTENTVIELQRVLNDTVSDRQISNALYDLAQRYGQTFENASTIAQNFAKSGMSWNDTIKATESALLAMNVAELNASESSEGLLSIMVQFKKDASELETIVDQLNKTADKNPVTTEKLLKALQRTGSAAATSNLTLEKTIGIITTLSAATNRSGQNIGTATNALIMYTQKNLDIFAQMSEESAKVVDNFKRGTADIVDIWKAAQDEINKLKNDKDKFNSMIDLFGGAEGMEELNSSLHDELEDTFEQINSVYNIANTYRKNYFIALLDNLDRFDKVQTQLQDAQGYSQEENLKYMGTLEAKMNTLTSKWEYLANDEQGLLKFRKGLVDLGIQALDLIKDMGGIVNVLKTITGLIGGLVITIKSATIAKKVMEAAEAFRAMKDAVQGVATAGEAAQASFGWIGIAIAALTLIVGVVNGIKTNLDNARQAALDAADAQRENAEKLADLATSVSDLNTKSDTYYETEKKIVDLLGDKAGILDDLKDKTDKYSISVRNLTLQELEEQLATQETALKALGTPGNATFWDSWTGSQRNNFDFFATRYYADKGVSYDRTPDQALEVFGVIQDKAKEASHQMTLIDQKIRNLNPQIENYDQKLADLQTEKEKQREWWEHWNGMISEVGAEFEEYKQITESIKILQNAIDKLTGKVVHTTNIADRGKSGGFEVVLESDGEGRIFSTEDEDGDGGDGDGGTGSTTDEYLESLKAVVSLRKSELTLMQYQGASLDEQVAKSKEIQESLHVQAEYLRQKGADQAEINALSSEWYSIQESIVKLVKSQYTDEINLIKSRLTLMEHQEVSADKQIEQMKKIQDQLHQEAEYLRSIKATEEEINAVSSEWWTWQEKILKLYQETLNAAKEIELEAIEDLISSIQEQIDLEKEELSIAEKREAVAKAELDYTNAIKEARKEYVLGVLSDYLTALSDAQTLEEKRKAVTEAREKYATAQKEAQTKAVIDAMKAQKDLGNDALSLEEKRLAVEEARQALIDAQNDRTTRVLDETTGDWHYEANAQNVKSAQEKLADAMKSLDDYLEGEAWDELLEKMENGSLTEGEMASILNKWASEGYGSSEWVDKIREAYRTAIGTKADPDSLTGELNAVNSAVDNLNTYLKNQAIKELQQYIKDGNTSTEGMQQIMDKWLSMGEGGEIWSWSNGVVSKVSEAIQSGKYDDSKVQSSINNVVSAINGLKTAIENSYISKLNKLLTSGTAEEMLALIAAAKASGEVNQGVLDPYEKLQKLKAEKEAIEKKYEEASKAYDENNLNNAMAIVDGNGNVAVVASTNASGLDSATAKVVNDVVENVGAKFDAALAKQSMGIMVGATDRTPSATPIYNSSSSNMNDSHDTTINGVPIPVGMADKYTLSEMVDILSILG